MTTTYRMCTRCIMDTSDPGIIFDDQGACNHCQEYTQTKNCFPESPEEKKRSLDLLVESIKSAGKGKPYDCIIGLSGGVDSTYAAYFIKKELGLRPLAIHMDNGWNSELAVRNIENVVTKLDIDLETVVLDWNEFRSLQLAFLKASVPDCEIPTDHAIVASLLAKAKEFGVGYILSGNNYSTEGILPSSYSYGCFDWRYINDVNKKYGERKLKTYPHFSLTDRVVHVLVKRTKNIGILNYIEYDKSKAMEIITKELDWKYYGGKHYESIYTKFFQAHILPTKFGVDKRRAHLSSLVLSGQLSREAALEEIQRPLYDPKDLAVDKAYVAKKLGISVQDLENLLKAKPRYFSEFNTYHPFLTKTRWLVRFLKNLNFMPKRVGI